MSELAAFGQTSSRRRIRFGDVLQARRLRAPSFGMICRTGASFCFLHTVRNKTGWREPPVFGRAAGLPLRLLLRCAQYVATAVACNQPCVNGNEFVSLSDESTNLLAVSRLRPSFL